MGNLKKAIFLITFIVSALAVLQIVRAQVAIEPVKEYLDLPEETMPMGIAFDGKETIYVVSYWRGSIFALNIKTLTYKEYFVRGASEPLTLWGLTIDPYGNLWFGERDKFKIGMFDITTKTFEEYSVSGTGSTYGIIYNPFDGNVWFANSPYLSKINISSKKITDYEVGGTPVTLVSDSSGNIWFSDLDAGKLAKFNISSEKLEVEVGGFYRPLGIFLHGDLVYVAENLRPAEGDPGYETRCAWNISECVNGTVAIYNIASRVVTRINTIEITMEGPYMVYTDSYGSLWFTDNSAHTGIIGYSEVKEVEGKEFTSFVDTEDTIYNVKGSYVYFLTQVGEKIWFSGKGSSSFVGLVNTTPYWIYTFIDPKRETELRINPGYKISQFVTKDKEYSIKIAGDQMKVLRRNILIRYEDEEIKLTATIIPHMEFAQAKLIDKETGKSYMLIDLPKISKNPNWILPLFYPFLIVANYLVL